MCGLSNLNSGTFDNSLGRFVDDCKNYLPMNLTHFAPPIFLLLNFIRKDMFIEASFGIVPNCSLFKVMIVLSEIYLVTTNNSLHTAFLKYLGIKSKCKIC